MRNDVVSFLKFQTNFEGTAKIITSFNTTYICNFVFNGNSVRLFLKPVTKIATSAFSNFTFKVSENAGSRNK